MRFDQDHNLFEVGDRKFPVSASKIRDIDLGPEIDRVHHVRRVRLMFETGLELSIVWGCGTYSDNHWTLHGTHSFVEEPSTVEVMVMRNGEFVDGPDEFVDPHGYVDDEQLLDLIDKANAGEAVNR